MSIKIRWLGHASFKLTFGNWEVVLDPYENGSVPGLNNLEAGAMEVLCSHGHGDHNAAHLVRINRMFAPAPVIKKVDTFHDNEGGTKRGKNIVHVFEHEGLRLAHFGDLGHLLTPEQVAEIGPVDIALIPVGGFFTIDAATALQVCAQVGAKTVIPMHYRTEDFGFEVIGTLQQFTDLCDSVVAVEGDTIEINGTAPCTTFVLQPALLAK